MRASLTSAIAVVIVTATAQAQPLPTPGADPRVQQLVASISGQRLREIDAKLASFGTRETLSSGTTPGRGIAAARQWIFEELTRSSAKLQVSFDTYRLPQQGRITRAVELRNVIAILPGRSERRVYVSGHYDSLNIGSQQNLNQAAAGPDPLLRADFNHDVDAPGANDDGSGTALTMELARAFAESGISFDATIVFACWAGEEQGLFGSSAHAQKLAAQKIKVDALLNNDIVGNTHGGNGLVDGTTVRVYSLGPEDSMSRSLARYVARIAALYEPSQQVRVMAREDRFNRGSDHSSFTKQGFPAVVFREARENFDRQHSALDTVDGVDFEYLARNARINAAALASLALAPPAPITTGGAGNRPRLSRRPSGYDATLEWSPSAGAAAYRIYWRDAGAPDWQHSQTVGNVTRFVLSNVSIDDFVFGVAAVGADGEESLVSAYVVQPRAVPDVAVDGAQRP